MVYKQFSWTSIKHDKKLYFENRAASLIFLIYDVKLNCIKIFEPEFLLFLLTILYLWHYIKDSQNPCFYWFSPISTPYFSNFNYQNINIVGLSTLPYLRYAPVYISRFRCGWQDLSTHPHTFYKKKLTTYCLERINWESLINLNY